jgi:hypothetical protein
MLGTSSLDAPEPTAVERAAGQRTPDARRTAAALPLHAGQVLERALDGPGLRPASGHSVSPDVGTADDGSAAGQRSSRGAPTPWIPSPVACEFVPSGSAHVHSHAEAERARQVEDVPASADSAAEGLACMSLLCAGIAATGLLLSTAPVRRGSGRCGQRWLCRYPGAVALVGLCAGAVAARPLQCEEQSRGTVCDAAAGQPAPAELHNAALGGFSTGTTRWSDHDVETVSLMQRPAACAASAHVSARDIYNLLLDREELRATGSFEEADRLRSLLLEHGVVVDDVDKTWTARDGRKGRRPDRLDCRWAPGGTEPAARVDRIAEDLAKAAAVGEWTTTRCAWNILRGRAILRKGGNFTGADRLRTHLQDLGFEINDKTGTWTAADGRSGPLPTHTDPEWQNFSWGAWWQDDSWGASRQDERWEAALGRGGSAGPLAWQDGRWGGMAQQAPWQGPPMPQPSLPRPLAATGSGAGAFAPAAGDVPGVATAQIVPPSVITLPPTAASPQAAAARGVGVGDPWAAWAARRSGAAAGPAGMAAPAKAKAGAALGPIAGATLAPTGTLAGATTRDGAAGSSAASAADTADSTRMARAHAARLVLIQDLFQLLDRDEDGALSPEELYVFALAVAQVVPDIVLPPGAVSPTSHSWLQLFGELVVGHRAPAKGFDQRAFGTLVTRGQGRVGGMALSSSAVSDVIAYLVAHYVGPAPALSTSAAAAEPVLAVTMEDGASAQATISEGPPAWAAFVPHDALVGAAPVVEAAAQALDAWEVAAEATALQHAPTTGAVPPTIAAVLMDPAAAARAPVLRPRVVRFAEAVEGDMVYLPSVALGHTRPDEVPQHLPCPVAAAAEAELRRAREVALAAAPHVPVWFDGEDMDDPRTYFRALDAWVLHEEDLTLDGDLVIFPSLWVAPEAAAALAAAAGPSAARPPCGRSCIRGSRARAMQGDAPVAGAYPSEALATTELEEAAAPVADDVHDVGEFDGMVAAVEGPQALADEMVAAAAAAQSGQEQLSGEWLNWDARFVGDAVPRPRPPRFSGPWLAHVEAVRASLAARVALTRGAALTPGSPPRGPYNPVLHEEEDEDAALFQSWLAMTIVAYAAPASDPAGPGRAPLAAGVAVVTIESSDDNSTGQGQGGADAEAPAASSGDPYELYFAPMFLGEQVARRPALRFRYGGEWMWSRDQHAEATLLSVFLETAAPGHGMAGCEVGAFLSEDGQLLDPQTTLAAIVGTDILFVSQLPQGVQFRLGDYRQVDAFEHTVMEACLAELCILAMHIGACQQLRR